MRGPGRPMAVVSALMSSAFMLLPIIVTGWVLVGHGMIQPVDVLPEPETPAPVGRDEHGAMQVSPSTMSRSATTRVIRSSSTMSALSCGPERSPPSSALRARASPPWCGWWPGSGTWSTGACAWAAPTCAAPPARSSSPRRQLFCKKVESSRIRPRRTSACPSPMPPAQRWRPRPGPPASTSGSQLRPRRGRLRLRRHQRRRDGALLQDRLRRRMRRSHPRRRRRGP